MIAATTSKRFKEKTKLLALTESDSINHTSLENFVNLLSSGDLLVINSSATLPSSFNGQLARTGEPVEIRLAAFQGQSPSHLSFWKAFLFGEGTWQIPTEKRASPPKVKTGDRIIIGKNLSVEILECQFDRLLSIEFLSSDLHRNLYHHGRPIQYSYLKEELAVWDQQTIFSGAPISVEPPSASFAFTWDLIFNLQSKGVVVADVLHGAGISSTGQEDLDELLPLIEWYQIPERTVTRFKRAKESNKRIIALGTSALRALESSWNGKELTAGSGLTSLKITSDYKIQTADALVTGMHEKGTSHMNILDSICSIEQIQKGYQEAEALEYRSHEYGDLTYLYCKE